MDMVDILFHVQPSLSLIHREKLETDLWGYEGVLSVHFNKDHEHLLMVEYDPQHVTSAQLLEHLNRQGVKASRIGL